MVARDLMEDEMVQSQEDVFATPVIEVPPSQPDAHRAVINGVILKHIDSRENWPVIEIELTSIDVPTIQDKIAVFVPKGFEEHVDQGTKFDTKTLPQVKGSFWTEEQTMFARNIANGDNAAVLQTLVFNQDSVARRSGRDPIELGLKKPTNLEEYTENISKMLIGLECIVTRRERGGDDPAFKHQLQMKRIFAADEYERNPKFFRKYVLAWDSN